MKKVFVPIVAVMITAMLLTSCKDNKKKILTRTWKVGDIRVSAAIPEEQRALFDAMLNQMKEYLRVTYKEDGSYSANFLGKTSTGKWIMTEKFDTLSAIDETGRTMKYVVVALTKDSFIYKTMEVGVDPITFVMLPGDTLPNTPVIPQEATQTEQPEASNTAAQEAK